MEFAQLLEMAGTRAWAENLLQKKSELGECGSTWIQCELQSRVH